MLEKTVLVVEDDQNMLDALEEKMTSRGYLVYTAKNGQEGLAAALEKKPRLIILDIVMPVMNGIEMLKALRVDGWGKNALVIILTNVSEKKQLAEALEIGVDEYLVKTRVKLSEIADRADAVIGAT